MKDYSKKDLKITKDKKIKYNILTEKDRCFNSLYIGNKVKSFNFFTNLLEQDFNKKNIGFTFFTNSEPKTKEIIKLAKKYNKEIVCVNEKMKNIYFNPLNDEENVLKENIICFFKKHYKLNEELNLSYIVEILEVTLTILHHVFKENLNFLILEKFLTNKEFSLDVLKTYNNILFIQEDCEDFSIEESKRKENIFKKNKIDFNNVIKNKYWNNVNNIFDHCSYLRELLSSINNNEILNSLFNIKTTYQIEFKKLFYDDKIIIINDEDIQLNENIHIVRELMLYSFNTQLKKVNDKNNNFHVLYSDIDDFFNKYQLINLICQDVDKKLITNIFVDSLEQFNELSLDTKSIFLACMKNKFFISKLDYDTIDYINNILFNYLEKYNKDLEKKAILTCFKCFIKTFDNLKEVDIIELKENEVLFSISNNKTMIPIQKGYFK